MRILVARKHEHGRRPLKDVATEADYDELITEPTKVVDEDGSPIVVYDRIDRDYGPLLRALRRMRYSTTNRTQKIDSRGADDPNQTSRVFGYRPRRTGRQDWCRAVRLAYEDPRSHAQLVAWADYLTELFERHSPERWARHKELMSDVLDCWRMGDSVFTSGIANRSNPMPYHFDAGNFSGSWSGMLGFQRDMGGGDLVLPDYRLAFRQEGGRATLFDGQGVLHGITHFNRRSRLSYRYTVVYYSMRLMKHCGTPEEELARVQKVKTQREIRRATKDHR